MKQKMVRFIADHKQKLKKLLPKKLLRAAKLAEAAPLLAETETAYRKIINAISALTSD